MARKKGQISKFLVGIMLVMLMVGLAGFGVTNFGGQIRTVGEVGDVEISINEYARALEAELRALQQQTGQNISLEQARQFGVDTQVMQRLIGQAAFENETKRIGLSVGDAEVQRQILNTQGFRGLDGQFDRDAYEFTLERNNLSVQEFESNIRSETAGTILQSAILTGIAPPATFRDIMVAYLGERRSFSWMELDATALSDPIPEPTADQLQTYFDENIDSYTVPQSKDLTYAWLSPEMVMDQITIDDATLRAIYDSRSDEYNIPERRLVERLVFATQQEAETARASIASGKASFDDVVAARGLELADIDLGDVTQNDLDAGAEAVFSMTDPGITDAVETDLGPGIFRVNAILAARSTAFEDARAELLDASVADNARRLVEDLIADYDDLLAGGATLEELADETEMVLEKFNWTAGATEGIAAYDGFANAATAITPEDFPSIEVLDDGSIFALRLDANVDAHPDSFENVSAQVADDWKAAQLAKALEAETAIILGQLSAGATLSSLGYPVAVQTNAKRDTQIADKPAGFLTAAFELDENAATSVADTGRVFIIQMNKIQGADPQDPDREALLAAIDSGNRQTMAQDALSAFTRALQLGTGISLNQTAINSVHAQFSSN